jgi:hypothetical protein
MSHLSFSYSFRLTDIEQDFGSEKARVRGGGVGGPWLGCRDCRGRRSRTVNFSPSRWSVGNPSNPMSIHTLR